MIIWMTIAILVILVPILDCIGTILYYNNHCHSKITNSQNIYHSYKSKYLFKKKHLLLNRNRNYLR